MRILAISSYAGLGGSELAFLTFLEHLPDDVEAEVLLVSDGPLRERIEATGLPLQVADGGDGRPNLAMLAGFRRQLNTLLADGRFSTAWAVGQKAALLAAAPCRRRRVPMVWHKVDFSWDRLLAVPLALASSGVIAVSAAVADTLGPMRRRRPVTIVGPPVRLPRRVSPGFDPEHPTIGTLGRLVPYKGHHLIIEATALLRDEFPAVRALLAGGEAPQYPGYPAELEALADRLGVAGSVELAGHVDAAELLERLSVFVNATYRDEQGFGLEGLSGAMLEASSAGLPVVATRGGGTAEGLRDGETGTLVERPDAAALAAAIRPYLADPGLARRTGEAGRRFVEDTFAPEAVSARLWHALRASERQAGASSS
jgi:phosphatidylinositol alpha-1,6-mannosyltransferase